MHTLSLMSFQIILVISSPSSSTTGFLTLIFLNAVAMLRRCPNCRWVATSAALGACLEALGTAVREEDVRVFAEARRQRKAVLLFISREDARKLRDQWVSIPRTPNREFGRFRDCRSRLSRTGPMNVWCRRGINIRGKGFLPLNSEFAAEGGRDFKT